MKKLVRVIAFYLPQYHPIPENDKWWGKGFTEWTNVAKAKPLYHGHYQPHIPADLGFYDLRVPETRLAQAELAKEYGIEGFCYYHYWFGGRRILDRPFNEVLESGEPDLPFCVCWANQTWTGIWHGLENQILIEQTYPGLEDHRNHFRSLLKAFSDPRYLTVDGKPIFIIYRPMEVPEVVRVTDFWREMALDAGLKGLHLVGVNVDSNWNPHEYGFDASITPKLPEFHKWRTRWYSWRQPIKKVTRYYRKVTNKPAIYLYEEEWEKMLNLNPPRGVMNYPCLIPNWDNTPRSGANGMVLQGSTPELFAQKIRKALKLVAEKPQEQKEQKIIFIKAWNEWAEGNYLEPDLKFGRGYLEAIKKEIFTKTG
ncbi:MAG: glycoside hydrolase family 99-like domain-containing protein [Desulfuromonadales bacterium]|nr:glycoside hydrolase family 99-like domain-containing protein [Desulfuromonadales bacterium]